MEHHLIPRVSAVIPTRNRPDLVCRAVRSVLSQTFQSLECIVVIDGPDPATIRMLQTIHDARLIVLALKENVGGCEARNTGARAARGQWVALLDDDDEWLPERLEKQLATADQAKIPVTMVASRFFDRGTSGELIRPRKFPRERQHIAEFLWSDGSPLGGIEGFPQTSTWLIRRDFLLEVPFTKGLPCLQDLDWLLHGFAHPRMCALFVDEPLTIFHNDHARDRVAKAVDWHYSHGWATKNRDLFTRKALGFFIVIHCVNPAAQQGAGWNELSYLFRECRRWGKINSKLVLLCALYTFIYPAVSRMLPTERRRSLLYKATNRARAR